MTTFIALRCLAGAGAPPDMQRDLRALAELPEGARTSIWTILGPALNERVPADLDRAVGAFATRHEVSPERVAALVRAYRVLLRSAFVVDASPRDLANDLDAVARDEDEGERLRTAILPAFPSARELLRQEASGGAVSDHGAVLLGVDWRLDRLVASTRGESDGAFVGMVTLRFREGERERRLTVQALPEAIGQLRDACDRMMKAAERASR